MTYTGLAKLGTRRWETRRYEPSKAAPQSGETPIEETRFSCPECRQYFPYDGTCDRCERPLVDRTVALPASPAIRRPRWAVSGSPGMILLVSFSLLGPWLLFEGTRNPGIRYFIGVIFALLASMLVGGIVVRSVLDWRHRRKSRARVRAQALAQPCVPTATLSSAEAPELVRLAGRLRFDVGATGVRVRVCDESGSAVLPERPLIHAYRADGTHEELDSIRDGDEVEVIAACRRVSHAGNGYRQAASELELSPEEPVFVWVKSR